MTKSELARLYGVTVRTLCKHLNGRYFKQLSELGYRKTDKYLPPKIVNEFKKIWGEP